MPKLHIVCLRPGGMHRAGAHHKGHGIHELSDFAAERLSEMRAEPDLVLIVGGEALTDKDIAAVAAKAKAEKKA